jgi:hypothetical protein
VARLSRSWDSIIVVSALAAITVNWLAIAQPVRLMVVGWFLLVCPGMAVVRVLRLHAPAAEWMLALAISLSVDMVVGEAMVYAGRWAPSAGLLIIATVAVMAVWIPRLLSPVAEPRWVPVAVPDMGGAAGTAAAPAHRAPLLQAARPEGDASRARPPSRRRRTHRVRVPVTFEAFDEPGLKERAGVASEGIIRELALDVLNRRR